MNARMVLGLVLLLGVVACDKSNGPSGNPNPIDTTDTTGQIDTTVDTTKASYLAERLVGRWVAIVDTVEDSVWAADEKKAAYSGDFYESELFANYSDSGRDAPLATANEKWWVRDGITDTIYSTTTHPNPLLKPDTFALYYRIENATRMYIAPKSITDSIFGPPIMKRPL